MFACGIFKVIYAPQKAFREIAQNPRYIGPILIMVLFIAGNIAFAYAFLTKMYIEQTMPDAATYRRYDEWTENKTFWLSTYMPGIAIEENAVDFINASSAYYGNRSIQFSITNSDVIWMQLDDIGLIDCSEDDGYKNISLRIKRLLPNEKPESAIIYLFSSATDYFHYDFADQLSDSIDKWDNVTISLRDTAWQKSSDNANWSNINKLKLEFSWTNTTDITLLVDGLFFHGIYKSFMDFAGDPLISFNNPYSIINSFIQFTIQWVFLGGVLYLVPKMFGTKTLWRPLLIAAGFILIIYFLRMVIFATISAVSPSVYYSLAYLGGVPGEWEETFQTQISPATYLAYQMFWYVDKIIWVWTIALSTILLQSVFALSWIKSLLASVVSFTLYLFLLIMFAPAPPILL